MDPHRCSLCGNGFLFVQPDHIRNLLGKSAREAERTDEKSFWAPAVLRLRFEEFMPEWDVVVVGAGAAGLFCAIEAGKRGRRVLLIEHSDRAGKKIEKKFAHRDLPPGIFNIVFFDEVFCDG